MKQHMMASRLFILALSGIVGSFVGCSPEQTLTMPTGSGGPSDTGGSTNSSSTSSQGGSSASGTGTDTQGGVTNTGGAGATDGGASGNTGGSNATNTGGSNSGTTGGTSSSTGGKTATGGKSSTSSSSATGGKTATGGSAATGGSDSSTGGTDTATGGAAGPTGGAAATNSGTAVTFSSSGKASGAMNGWSFVALGADDTISDPTCGTATAEITNATPCDTTTNWSGTSGICITGSIPALPATPVDADYTNNWGVSLGVNAGDPDTKTLGQSFASITFTITGSPSTGLRAIVSVGTTDYCAEGVSSGTAITFTEFNTKCYDTTASGAKALAAADVTKITKVSLQVSSSSKATTVTNLCITGIKFG